MSYEGHRNRAPNAREVGTIYGFRQITRCVSKIIQNIRIVSVKGEEELICTLSNDDIADVTDVNLITPKLPLMFWVSLHILGNFVHG